MLLHDGMLSMAEMQYLMIINDVMVMSS